MSGSIIGFMARKLLVASIGVATMTYVATTSLLGACGSSGKTGGSGGDSGNTGDGQMSDSPMVEEGPVANLAVMPDSSGMQPDSPSDVMQVDDFPVANLAAMPDAGFDSAGG